MNEQRAITRASRTPGIKELLKQYECGPIQLTGTNNALYERHLIPGP
jgi:glycogen phosphorylase